MIVPDEQRLNINHGSLILLKVSDLKSLNQQCLVLKKSDMSKQLSATR